MFLLLMFPYIDTKIFQEVTFYYELYFFNHITNTLNISFKNLGFIIRNSRKFSELSKINLLLKSLRSKLEYYASSIRSSYYRNHIDAQERT